MSRFSLSKDEKCYSSGSFRFCENTEGFKEDNKPSQNSKGDRDLKVARSHRTKHNDLIYEFQVDPKKTEHENSVLKSDIWFRFKEGYSNAVRRNLKVKEFL